MWKYRHRGITGLMRKTLVSESLKKALTRNGFMTLKAIINFCDTYIFESNKNDRAPSDYCHPGIVLKVMNIREGPIN